MFDLPTAECFHLMVGQQHRLYVETCGNPQGVPLVVLHGGPGGGIHAGMRQYFDQQHWRVVMFDQRGAGRSTPSACVQDNTTEALLADMEKLRELLGIERWWLFGGSWGTTLGLLYAQRYPERCLGLILRGVFLSRQRDLDWLYAPEGAARLYPREWRDFTWGLAAGSSEELLAAYREHLSLPREEALPWAQRWARWEARLSTLLPSEAAEAGFDDKALALARIENHYFCQHSFIEENQIIHQAHRLADLPGFIVHGRQDLVCPLEQAQALADAWPRARLQVVEGAGHSASESGVEAALMLALAAARTCSEGP